MKRRVVKACARSSLMFAALAAALAVVWSGAVPAANLSITLDRVDESGAAIEKAHYWGHSNCKWGYFKAEGSWRGSTGWHRHEGTRFGIPCARKVDLKRKPPRKRVPIDPRFGGPQPDPPGRK